MITEIVLLFFICWLSADSKIWWFLYMSVFCFFHWSAQSSPCFRLRWPRAEKIYLKAMENFRYRLLTQIDKPILFLKRILWKDAVFKLTLLFSSGTLENWFNLLNRFPLPFFFFKPVIHFWFLCPWELNPEKPLGAHLILCRPYLSMV